MSYTNGYMDRHDRQCQGKHGYTTKKTAKTSARRAEATIGRVSAYRCPHCGLFHLGHKR